MINSIVTMWGKPFKVIEIINKKAKLEMVGSETNNKMVICISLNELKK